MVGQINQLGVAFRQGLSVMAVLFFYQHWLGRSRLSTNYFKAFINSHWAALSVWLGLLIDFG